MFEKILYQSRNLVSLQCTFKNLLTSQSSVVGYKVLLREMHWLWEMSQLLKDVVPCSRHFSFVKAIRYQPLRQGSSYYNANHYHKSWLPERCPLGKECFCATEILQIWTPPLKKKKTKCLTFLISGLNFSTRDTRVHNKFYLHFYLLAGNVVQVEAHKRLGFHLSN